MRELTTMSRNLLFGPELDPRVEMIFGTHEGFDPVSDGVRNRQECRIVMRRKNLREMIDYLTDRDDELKDMESAIEPFRSDIEARSKEKSDEA